MKKHLFLQGVNKLKYTILFYVYDRPVVDKEEDISSARHLTDFGKHNIHVPFSQKPPSRTIQTISSTFPEISVCK